MSRLNCRMRAYPRHPWLESLFGSLLKRPRIAGLHEARKQKFYPQIFRITADIWRAHIAIHFSESAKI